MVPPEPTQPDPSAPRDRPVWTVVVPAYREEARLPASLERLPRELEAAGVASFEILVVDDGSPDGTARVAREAAAVDPRIRVLVTPRNRGKGHAVRTGVEAARGSWILVTDADLSTPPADVVRLFAPASAADGLAIGSRRMRGARILVRQPLHREILGFVFAALRRILVLPVLRDTQCGFKVFRADVARRLFAQAREDRFIYDLEILLLARAAGLRIPEVAVRWSDDPRSQVHAVRASGEMGLGLLRLARRRAVLLLGRPPR